MDFEHLVAILEEMKTKVDSHQEEVNAHMKALMHANIQKMLACLKVV